MFTLLLEFLPFSLFSSNLAWMDYALDPAASIYEGVWTDWTKGSTWGLTVTLCPDQAVLVTSALAVFVTLAGSQLWTIVRFTLHQTKNPPTPDAASPTEHTKQQLILRNAATDLATARLMTSLAWSSRRRGLPKRTIAIAIFAMTHAVLFMVAGTFSNRAISVGSTTDGSPVLSKSKHCGVMNETYWNIAARGLNPESNETLEMSVRYVSDRAHKVQLSLQYAQECYLKEQTTQYMSSSCNTLKSPKLQWKTQAGTCPFDPSICHNGATSVVLETDIIDSHRDLGINAKPEERLTYQRRTTCAVLNDTGRVRGWDGDIDIGATEVTKDTAYAFYGPTRYMGDDSGLNITYTYSNFASLFDNFTSQVTIPYQVGSAFALGPTSPAYTESDFDPIQELAQDSADLVLFFLSFSGRYLTEINDPWFSAHDKQSSGVSIPLLENLFRRDTAISTMGCIEQHQFCTNSGVCTGYLGYDQVQNHKPFNEALNDHQNVTFDRLLRAANGGTLGRVVEDLSLTSTPMQAVGQLAFGKQVISLPIPDDQWKVELDFWHSIAMAQIQRTLAQWGTGQIAAEPSFLQPPETERDKWFCNSLMIPSTVYQSFSMMSIILMLIFGTLIIAISLNVERIARAIRRCGGRGGPKKGWDHDDMLKLTSRIRDSIFRPKPPRKDDGYRPAMPPLTPAITVSSPTVRQVSSEKSEVTTLDESWKRSSSPTLPLDDRELTSSHDTSIRFAAVDRLAPPVPAHRYDRDSWMAISLSDEEINNAAARLEYPSCANQINTAEEKPKRQSPIIRNFRVKGPRQYHLPLNQSSWI